MFRLLQSCDDADAVPASSSADFVPDNYDPPLPQPSRRRNWSRAFDAGTRADLQASIASGAGAELVTAAAAASASSGAPRGNSGVAGLAFLFGLIWLANR